MKGRYPRTAAGLLALSLTGAAGCAKDPTAVVTDIWADATVPPILRLRTRMTASANPGRASSAERSSSTEGDAADRPGPFLFPIRLQLTVDPSFAGEVVLTVEGLDWDTRTVLARGSTGAQVIAERETYAVVTLSGTGASPNGDAGAGDGGTDDGGTD